MRFLCRRLLSERGEASQAALAQESINAYEPMNPAQRRETRLQFVRGDFGLYIEPISQLCPEPGEDVEHWLGEGVYLSVQFGRNPSTEQVDK
jgi:hypothetical protein